MPQPNDEDNDQHNSSNDHNFTNNDQATSDYKKKGRAPSKPKQRQQRQQYNAYHACVFSAVLALLLSDQSTAESLPKAMPGIPGKGEGGGSGRRLQAPAPPRERPTWRHKIERGDMTVQEVEDERRRAAATDAYQGTRVAQQSTLTDDWASRKRLRSLSDSSPEVASPSNELGRSSQEPLTLATAQSAVTGKDPFISQSAVTEQPPTPATAPPVPTTPASSRRSRNKMLAPEPREEAEEDYGDCIYSVVDGSSSGMQGDLYNPGAISSSDVPKQDIRDAQHYQAQCLECCRQAVPAATNGANMSGEIHSRLGAPVSTVENTADSIRVVLATNFLLLEQGNYRHLETESVMAEYKKLSPSQQRLVCHRVMQQPFEEPMIKKPSTGVELYGESFIRLHLLRPKPASERMVGAFTPAVQKIGWDWVNIMLRSGQTLHQLV